MSDKITRQEGIGREGEVVVLGEPGRTTARLARLLEGFGARLQLFFPPWPLEHLQYSTLCAVVVLSYGEGDSAQTSAFDIVKVLSAMGFTVIVCKAGAVVWPLAVRCRLLLNGCVAILDTLAEGFATEFRRLLFQALRMCAERAEEEEHLKHSMRLLGLIGQSAPMLAVFRLLTRVSVLSDVPTLLIGETGTGKELLARAIYALDAKRSCGPFVAVNCGEISPSLVESELFGHRRGAFTGADRDRRGLIRAAQSGVLFLDEIGELAPAVQAKLLRVLQESLVRAVGDEQEVPVSVRLISATNCELSTMVEEGKFRADLFHRLNVLPIRVPPLRERRTDIPPLVEHFAAKHRHLNSAASASIHPEFMEALSIVELPGNARQLENLVRCALVHNDGTAPLGLNDLSPDVWQQLAADPLAAPLAGAATTLGVPSRVALESSETRSPGYAFDLLTTNDWNLAQSLKSCERSILQEALRASHGNHSQAARLLGITPRSVYNKVRRYRLP
jgi:transcriptional regulator with GAF, ATPase, and Fis domain